MLRGGWAPLGLGWMGKNGEHAQIAPWTYHVPITHPHAPTRPTRVRRCSADLTTAITGRSVLPRAACPDPPPAAPPPAAPPPPPLPKLSLVVTLEGEGEGAGAGGGRAGPAPDLSCPRLLAALGFALSFAPDAQGLAAALASTASTSLPGGSSSGGGSDSSAGGLVRCSAPPGAGVALVEVAAGVWQVGAGGAAAAAVDAGVGALVAAAELFRAVAQVG